MAIRVCITCYEACELSLIFSILRVVVLEKNSGHLYSERNNRKPGLAEPETLKFGRSK